MTRPERCGRALSISERVYKALLKTYPEEFREEYGAQMAQVFRDLCREELGSGGKVGLVRLWVHTILDLAATALTERRSANYEEVGMSDHKLAGTGFALLLTPLLFVSMALLKYGMGVGFLFDPLDRALLSDTERLHVFNLVSPVVFLGGLGLALALNAYAVFRLNLNKEDGGVVGTVRLRISFWNIAVVAMSLLLLIVLVGYAFLENLTLR